MRITSMTYTAESPLRHIEFADSSIASRPLGFHPAAVQVSMELIGSYEESSQFVDQVNQFHVRGVPVAIIERDSRQMAFNVHRPTDQIKPPALATALRSAMDGRMALMVEEVEAIIKGAE